MTPHPRFSRFASCGAPNSLDLAPSDKTRFPSSRDYVHLGATHILEAAPH
jgi:hypothetical protein